MPITIDRIDDKRSAFVEYEEYEEICHAWIAYQTMGTFSDFWAPAELARLCEKDPENAWIIIQMIFRRVGETGLALKLASGPLECLLTHHGPEMIEAVERLAREDKLFRSNCLARLWRSGIDTETWSRIRSAAA
jgi:hypothetical protein